MNGGYAMIDCKGLDLLKGETPQTIAGLYDRVKLAMLLGKPLLACNMIWGAGRPVSPVYCFGIDWGDDGLIVTASTLQICISKQSVVTIVNMAPAG